MRRLSLLSWVALFGCQGGDADEFARAFVVDRLDGAVGGPKAIARTGDLVIENDRLRVAVLAARSSMGPGLHGGSIVDVDLQWNDPRFPVGRGNDQFAEMFPTANLNVMAPEQASDVAIISDGSDGGPAVVRVTSASEPFLTLLSALWGIVSAPKIALVTDYILEPGEPWLTLRTTATVPWDGASPPLAVGAPIDYPEAEMPLLPWAVETGLAMGDFYLQGGAIDVFAPRMGFDENGAVFDANQLGKNTITEPFIYDFVAGVGDGISYGLAPVQGTAFVPLFTASQTAIFGGGKEGDGSKPRFPAGSAFTYERRLYVGNGDVGSIVDAFLESRERPFGRVDGHVTEAATGTPVSGTWVFAYEVREGVAEDRPYNAWRTDVDPRDDVADGSYGGRLPVGTWDLVVHRQGRPDAEPVRVEVEEGGSLSVPLLAGRPGVLRFTVRDEIGQPVPSKVSIFPESGVPQRDPNLGDPFIAGGPEMVVFPMYGEGEVELPPGRYIAIASRGLEYEFGISEPFAIDAQSTVDLDLRVERSVDTSGWVSADLHVHAFPSHDSGVLLADRVRTMVSEGVEFFSSNDHDYLTDYAPVIEQLGMERWVQSSVGNEVTTIEIGHFLGFPLGIDYRADVNGAIDWTDRTPAVLIDDLRALGRDAGHEPIIFVGHPRDGILGYFDQYGLDPYAGFPGGLGEVGTPMIRRPTLTLTNPLLASELLSWNFDGLEILNGKRFDLIRTPTQHELDRFAAGEAVSAAEMVSRTEQEQQDLINGVYRLGYGVEGQVDDWFTLLNLGFRYTALGNSDTHGWTSTEAGCPRNFVIAETDDPAFLDDQEMADAVREHRVVASYGPFVQMWVNGHPIGSEVVAEGGPIEVEIDVQAPTWMDVDHVELYENGTLIRSFPVAATGTARRFQEVVELQPSKDSWYVVIVTGDQELAPLFTSVERPELELQMVVSEALGGIAAVSSLLSPAVPIPRTYPVLPYALTNPIWVDLAGDGFQAPGRPSWLLPPVEPEP